MPNDARVKKGGGRKRGVRLTPKRMRRRAPLAQAPFGKVLLHRPKPLIHPAAKMVLVFSAKAASTNVVIWFLHQLGHAKAAADYNAWPHRYRNDVYYGTRLYREAAARDLSGYSLVRVVRDPFERAASSYRHALVARYADDDMAKTLGCTRAAIASRGYSFSEFMDMLERADLRACNPHFRLQRHPIEDRLPTRHLINITTENLYQRLNQVEDDLGLPRTDFASLEWLNETRSIASAPPSDARDAYRQPMPRQVALDGPWPAKQALLTPEARKRLAALYAVDVSSYLEGAR